jgi:TPR repeat protein
MKKDVVISWIIAVVLLAMPKGISAQHIIRPTHNQIEAALTKPQDNQIKPKVMPAAEMYNKGYEYHQQKEYEQALLWFRKAALQKNPMAQNMIGQYFEQGLCVEQNDAEAAEWYCKAAQLGYDEGEYNYGRCYEQGIGIGANMDMARQWWQKAASQGYEPAINKLKE